MKCTLSRVCIVKHAFKFFLVSRGEINLDVEILHSIPNVVKQLNLLGPKQSLQKFLYYFVVQPVQLSRYDFSHTLFHPTHHQSIVSWPFWLSWSKAWGSFFGLLRARLVLFPACKVRIVHGLNLCSMSWSVITLPGSVLFNYLGNSQVYLQLGKYYIGLVFLVKMQSVISENCFLGSVEFGSLVIAHATHIWIPNPSHKWCCWDQESLSHLEKP